MLEVCAFPKPGNVDRCHDYPDTRLEHFLASTILARPALERAERGEGGVGELILTAVENTSVHSGGNTHFGAFILLTKGGEGLLHISKISKQRVEKVSDILSVGQEIDVKVLKIQKDKIELGLN